MTPKEKAEQLVDKYLTLNGVVLGLDLAKQCALIAVGEMYKLDLIHGQHLETDQYKEMYYSYWEEVKTEIEKL